MPIENADEVILWVRRINKLIPLTINDDLAVPSLQVSGPGHITWSILIEAGTNVGSFKLTLQDRVSTAVETYDNLIVNDVLSNDFIETRINGNSNLPLTVQYLGAAAGNPANGIYTPTGDLVFETRAEAFRTLPQVTGEHDLVRYNAERTNLLAALTDAEKMSAIGLINKLLVEAATKLGV